MINKIFRICNHCKTQMKLIACPDGHKWQCQNPKCPNSKITGTYQKQ